MFFSLRVQSLKKKKKKEDKSKIAWLALLFKHFFIKIQPNMSEQEKKLQRIYELLNAETNPKNFKNNWFHYGLHQAFDYATWGILENKTNTTSHPNIGLLKTAVEEEYSF